MLTGEWKESATGNEGCKMEALPQFFGRWRQCQVCRLPNCFYESLVLQRLIARIFSSEMAAALDSNEDASPSSVAEEMDKVEAFNQMSFNQVSFHSSSDLL